MSQSEESWKKQLVSDLRKQPPTNDVDVRPSICQAPPELRSISPDHFQPKVLHLGLHSRRPYADGCEELKVALVQVLLPLQCSDQTEAELKWDKVVDIVVTDKKHARQQYERSSGGAEAGYLDTTEMGDDDVASMLALDAICVVAFLQVCQGECSIQGWDNIFRDSRWWVRLGQMETDLALVQNQVPMSCLKGAVRVVLDLGPGANPSQESVVEEELEKLLHKAVSLLYPLVHEKTFQFGINALGRCKHILDCLYLVLSGNLTFPADKSHISVADEGIELQSLVCSAAPDSTATDLTADDTHSQAPARCACRLKEVGIVLRSRPCTLSEIKFNDRTLLSSQLLLPQLHMYDTTAAELRNLAVYEFVEYPWQGHVRQYMRFINDLLSDAADAKLLVDSGVIFNHVGGFDEIVSIWTSLNRGISLPCPDKEKRTSVEVAQECIRKHCRNRFKLWMVDIRSKPFGKTTLTLFTLSAVILFFAAVLQAIHGSLKWDDSKKA